MERILDENSAVLAGRVVTEPQFSHKTYGESFYIFMLSVERKSGYEDRVPVMISERLMLNVNVNEGDFVTVTGQIRTYNQKTDGHNHLLIVVFVKEVDSIADYGNWENHVILEGFLCKKPVRRTSPLGREICDIMLAVNRMYNKSDYIPCIAWGRNAAFAGELEVGDKLFVEGRLQSRQYRKYDENGCPVEKTAYEVSIIHMEDCE